MALIDIHPTPQSPESIPVTSTFVACVNAFQAVQVFLTLNVAPLPNTLRIDPGVSTTLMTRPMAECQAKWQCRGLFLISAANSGHGEVLVLPNTRIISIPLNDKVARRRSTTRRHDLHIPSLWVRRAHDAVIPSTHTNIQDLHIMPYNPPRQSSLTHTSTLSILTMQMSRMRRIIIVMNHSPHRLRRTHIPHIPLRIQTQQPTTQRMAQHRIIKIRAETLIAHVHQHMRAVALHTDIELLRRIRCAECKRERGLGLRQRIIGAGARVC